MTVTYTTAAIVKKQCKFINTTDLADADIETNIEQAEGIVDGIMKKTGRGSSPDFTFDATKHGPIRDLTTCLATLKCITYDVEQFTSSSTATTTGDLLWEEADRLIKLLSDERFVEFLVNL